MGFDKIEAVSLTDQFVQKIESMIISGELMPGDQLPPARELSARMGVSRPVISAGLIELEKMGHSTPWISSMACSIVISPHLPRKKIRCCDYTTFRAARQPGYLRFCAAWGKLLS